MSQIRSMPAGALPGVQDADLLRVVLEHSEQGVGVYDVDRRLILWNDRWLQLLELPTRFGRYGMPIAEILLWQAERGDFGPVDPVEEAQRRLAEFEIDRIHEWQRRGPSGAWLHFRRTPMIGGGVASFVTDITDRMRSESELEARRLEAIEATRLLADALDHSNDGFVLWDRERRLTIWNAAYARLVPGVADILHIGLSLTDFVAIAITRRALAKDPGESDEAAIARWLDRYQRDTTYEHLRAVGGWMLSSNRVLADGSILWTRTDITHLKTREAEQAEHAARLEDLTRKLDLARLEAESASRAKSRFLAQVSHELRTPLNAILGFSDFMRRQQFGRLGNDKYLSYSDDIHGAGSHLLQVINQILDLAKVEAGRMAIDPQRNSLRRLIDESLKLVKVQAEAGRIQLDAEISELPLWADRRLAKQALVNILGNAIKFTPPGGTVTVEGTIVDGETVITISDTGPGMTEAEIAVALEPFGRVETLSRHASEGTGLGLPLVKAFLELHSGRIEIRSVKGRGTSVVLRFPLPPA